MIFLNQRWFDRHDALLAARGASSRSAILAPDGQVIGWATNGGILGPVRAELQPGARLVRFGQLGMPAAVARGNWWMEWAEYRRVEQYADRRGLPVAVAVRLLCCVPIEWSAMDVVVQARLKAPLLAYRGVGAPAVQTDKRTGTSEYLDGLPDPAMERISQLFIPGLGSADLQHDAVLIEGFGHLPAGDSRSGYIIRPA